MSSCLALLLVLFSEAMIRSSKSRISILAGFQGNWEFPVSASEHGSRRAARVRQEDSNGFSEKLIGIYVSFSSCHVIDSFNTYLAVGLSEKGKEPAL